MTIRLAVAVLALMVPFVALRAHATNSVAVNPSIFVRYQFEVTEIIQMLEASQGKPLDPQSAAARWLDEMGWRKWVVQAAGQPFTLTSAMREQLLAQEKFLRSTFSYQVGDVVWVPAEQGEHPYNHSEARVNPRGQIVDIVKGERETFFLVEVGVDNGPKGGVHTIPGKYYDGRPGPVLDYSPTFNITKKRYLFSLSEMERYNGSFRSQSVGSDTGSTVDYSRDQKWIKKLSEFKDKVVAQGLEVDFTASASEIYAKQRALIVEMFHHFKMNRNAPGGGPLLGDLANGGGACFAQACVLSHGVHAVGEPYGIKAMNISGTTVNPIGGHGFTRITVRGPEEVHVYDLVKDAQGQVLYRGLEIKSNMINYISDPGWADYGVTEDFFAMMPVETAINPIPIDSNRAINDLIQGKSFEDVVLKYGGKGPLVTNTELHGEWFDGSRSIEFLAPHSQIAQAAELERSLGSRLDGMLNEARTLKSNLGKVSVREFKSRIFTDLVETRAASLVVPGISAEGVRILVTEYLFRALK
ncbi:hypothetical protein WDW37_07565 [Bdellovibrionota bacterium FG-1]